MIECLNCKTTNTDKSVICNGCGYSLAQGERLSEHGQRVYTEEERMQQKEDEIERYHKEERKRRTRIRIIIGMLAINICGFVYGIMNRSFFPLGFYLGMEFMAFLAFVLYCDPMLFFYWKVARFTEHPDKTTPSDSYLFISKIGSCMLFVLATSLVYTLAILDAKM